MPDPFPYADRQRAIVRSWVTLPDTNRACMPCQVAWFERPAEPAGCWSCGGAGESMFLEDLRVAARVPYVQSASPNTVTVPLSPYVVTAG